MVGKLVGIIWRATQACLDRKSRSVDSVKYTICLVDRVSPAGVSPHSRSTKAPAMSIPLLLAVVIFIETGRRSCFCRPNFSNRAVPARHDWHPVSAMAETSTHDAQFSCAITQPLLAHHWRVHQCFLTSRFTAPLIPWGASAPGGKMRKQLLKDHNFLNNSPIFIIESSTLIYFLFKKHCIQYISILKIVLDLVKGT